MNPDNRERRASATAAGVFHSGGADLLAMQATPDGLCPGRGRWNGAGAGGRADAELLFGLPLGKIAATANLEVELYDVVTVDQMSGRVAPITETYKKGRLRQQLRLAEVDGYGVSVGLGLPERGASRKRGQAQAG